MIVEDSGFRCAAFAGSKSRILLFCSRSHGVSAIIERHRWLIAGIRPTGDSVLLLPPLSCCLAIALARDSSLLSLALLEVLYIALSESPQLLLNW